MTQQPVNYYQSTPLTAISGQPRRALAIECSRRGASVAILELDCEGGLETVSLAETSGTNENRCSAHRFGVSDLEAWQDFRSAVTRACRRSHAGGDPQEQAKNTFRS